MEIIAHIHTDFSTKFGIPRQSGLVPEVKGKIIFTKDYRSREAVRGLEEFSHLWLIWEFSANQNRGKLTVRPPKLGGNTRMGVFATRSPFRPNPIGLSCVQLEEIEFSTEYGPVLHVAGADMMDGTPIYDIKPYLPYADAHPEAKAGFTEKISPRISNLEVVIPQELEEKIPGEKRRALRKILSQDPRPSYQQDENRVYGFGFAGFEIKFQVVDQVVLVRDILENENGLSLPPI